MRYRPALTGILAAAVVASVAYGYWRMRTHDQGASWSSNLGLAGEELTLFDSGRYESLEWGDLPPYSPVEGSWRQEGELIHLVPHDRNKRPRTLRRFDKFGCAFLQRVGTEVPTDLFPTGITPADFSVKDSGCRKKTEEQNELGRTTRR